MDATKRAMVIADIVSLAVFGRSQSWHQMNDEQFVHFTCRLREQLGEHTSDSYKATHSQHTEMEDFRTKLDEFSSTATE